MVVSVEEINTQNMSQPKKFGMTHVWRYMLFVTP